MRDQDSRPLRPVARSASATPTRTDVAAAQGIDATPISTELPSGGRRHLLRPILTVIPPMIVFVLLIAVWELGVRILNIPYVTLPAPSRIIQTIPTIDELWSDAYYTTVEEALPGFLLGSGLGFVVAVMATHSRFFARGVLPYAAITNSIPIIGMAPISVALFGAEWQSKAVIVAILTFFPMVLNAYRGLTSVDPVSLQLMRSYAANWWETLVKLRFPASLPYVFNALKINTTLAMIGAIVAEYFGGPFAGLGYYINNEAPELAMDKAWAAVVVACAIGIGAYMIVVIVERIFTSWHVSYRSGR
ncbi:MAG TPA: ABC transporter permease [Chloroflexota bacterium]